MSSQGWSTLEEENHNPPPVKCNTFLTSTLITTVHFSSRTSVPVPGQINTRSKIRQRFPFRKFNNSLTFTCEEGNPGIHEIAPNTTWSDTMYYNSLTQPNIGWNINIVDSFNGKRSFLPGLWFILSCLFVRQLWQLLIEARRNAGLYCGLN